MNDDKVAYEIRDGVAVMTFQNPPVNGLGWALRRAIVEDVERANADGAVDALVLMGSGAGFSGGADIGEFGTSRTSASPNLVGVIDALEESRKPIVAAINGVCMGGGLELALGCHYRVAVAGAKIALPEVKLGLLPGAGGTQRLPRLLGAEKALAMIVSGATVKSEELAGTALFDGFGEGDLLEFALRFARQVIVEKRGLPRVRDLIPTMPNHEAYFQFARTAVKAAAGRYPAPVACVDAVSAAFSSPFAAGLQRERELFNQLMTSSESVALRHVFQAERAASHVVGVAHDISPRAIRKVGVIGAGTMGGGIAMSLLNAGLSVILLETTQAALDRGLSTMRRNYQGALKRGSLTAEALEQRLARVTPTLDFASLHEVDLVIEAVFESMEVKKQVFEALDAVVRPGAILASNTSALNLDAIARFTKRPRDVVGMHFFSPANVMRLVEVVRGAATAADVLVTAMRLAKTLGKAAVVSGVCDGFIGNRMVKRYVDAAHDLVVAGALPQEVDAALESFGFAMGVFRMGDLAGLDIGRAALRGPTVDGVAAPRQIGDDLCDAGRLGQKTAAGWYRYETGSRNALPDPAVTQIIDNFRRANGIVPRPVASREIIERCVYALVNEGARILDEGIAQRGSDINVVYLNGYGFPAWRGGPMFYADGVGLSNVARALRRIAESAGHDAQVWSPAPLLTRLAQSGSTFNEFKGHTE